MFEKIWELSVLGSRDKYLTQKHCKGAWTLWKDEIAGELP